MSPLRPLAILSLAALSAGVTSAAEPVAAVKPSDWRPRRPAVEADRPLPPVADLIERLASPRFTERAAATRALARAGLAAVDPLRQAASADSPEVSIRAVSALEDLWLHAMEAGDDDAASAALTALDGLSAAGDPARRARIEALLSSYEALIEKFAVDEIRRLGGSVRYSDSMSIVDDVTGALRPQVMYVVVGTAWAGDEAGLRHIRRTRPQSGVVYFIRGTKLPEGAAERFAVDSGLRAEWRGAAYLGVQSDSFLLPGELGCKVGSAAPGTPAAKGGVRSGDLIIEFNGKPIAHFDQLVKEIERTRPGQVVDATVRRREPGDLGEAEVPLKITMEEWK